MKWTRCLFPVGQELRSCHPSLLFQLLAVILLAGALPARAEQVVEAFRTRFGDIRGVAVNPTDNSVWVASGGSITHLAANGSIVNQLDGFAAPIAIAVNPTDGSCWFTDSRSAGPELVHLAADGSEVWHGDVADPSWIGVNEADGSCWVGDVDPYGAEAVLHIAADGTELLRVATLADDVSVNPNDGSCWVAAEHTVVHFAEDGTTLSQVSYSESVFSVSVNPADGSCWAAIFYGNEVVHLAADGTELWHGDFANPNWVGVNEADGSCWVAGGYGAAWTAHLAANGTELLRVTGVSGAGSVNRADGTVWLADMGTELLHLTSDGTELWRGGHSYSDYRNQTFSVNGADGSCWAVSDTGVVHFAADGSELWSGVLMPVVYGLSAESANGSCWVAGADSWGGDNPRIVHLAEDGTELWRSDGTHGVVDSLAANASDGSCWFTLYGDHNSIVHLAQDGSEMLHRDYAAYPGDISLDPADDSVWVLVGDQLLHLAENGAELLGVTVTSMYVSYLSAVSGDGSCWYNTWPISVEPGIVHVAANGTELARIATGDSFGGISANGTDGSCWWTTGTEVVHFGANGAELWRGPATGSGETGYDNGAITVNSSDGSCWVLLNGGQLARLEVPGWRVPRFYDVPSYFWAFEQVEACVDANIVKGYDDGLYHPEYTVTRDQMAVYIARALVSPSGDAAIPDPEPPPSFSDVPSTHWAYKHIEYAVGQNVVKGYDDGTYLPSVTVDRGTMAVYIARAMVAPGGDAAIPDPVPPATFTDVPDTFWAYKQVEYCVGQGVVKGYDDGNYHPERPVTRDQMAVYIARAFGLL